MELNDQLAQALGAALKERKFMLATAESCTGGGVAEAVTAIAGSSEWFERGFVTYSNTSKREMLGVKIETIKKHGAVSEQVAREMGAGALQHSRANVAVAVSGIAGPGGGTAEKPVGTVCFAWAMKHGAVVSKTQYISGDRGTVREQATIVALRGLLDMLGVKPITIRATRADDDLAAIHRAAFPTEAESRLVTGLHARGKALVSLVAECGAQIAGNIVFSAVSIVEHPQCASGAGLAPVAVLPAMQGRGIGGKLTEIGLEICRKSGIRFVVVLGDPIFYQRFGFERASTRSLRNEYGADAEFMVIELASNSLPADGGLVRYEAEFAQLGGKAKSV